MYKFLVIVLLLVELQNSKIMHGTYIKKLSELFLYLRGFYVLGPLPQGCKQSV